MWNFCTWISLIQQHAARRQTRFIFCRIPSLRYIYNSSQWWCPKRVTDTKVTAFKGTSAHVWVLFISIKVLCLKALKLNIQENNTTYHFVLLEPSKPNKEKREREKMWTEVIFRSKSNDLNNPVTHRCSVLCYWISSVPAVTDLFKSPACQDGRMRSLKQHKWAFCHVEVSVSFSLQAIFEVTFGKCRLSFPSRNFELPSLLSYSHHLFTTTALPFLSSSYVKFLCLVLYLVVHTQEIWLERTYWWIRMATSQCRSTLFKNIHSLTEHKTNSLNHSEWTKVFLTVSRVGSETQR